MFYGRSRLLRELMAADPLHFLLVGPRRVGKSPVLRRVGARGSSLRSFG